MINRRTLAAGLALLALSSAAIASDPTVTVVSRGHDIRLILTDIFAQAKKSCIIQPNLHVNLFLSIEDMDFDQALSIICKHSGLEYSIQDGVYYVRRTRTDPTPAMEPAVFTKKYIPALPAVKPIQMAMVTTPNPLALKKKITTHMSKADIRAVFSAFEEQSGVKIKVDDSVPAYRLDAYLNNTSLKYALDTITRAAKLSYHFSDANSIVVSGSKS
jgi:type II secretory pathway component GspD/PulD (secretin)